MFLTRIKLTYEQFEFDLSLKEPTDVNLNPLGNVESSNNGRSEFKYQAYNGQNPSFSIDGSDDEEFVIEILETEPIDDAIDVGNDDPFNSNPNEIESETIINQDTFDVRNSNDRYFS